MKDKTVQSKTPIVVKIGVPVVIFFMLVSALVPQKKEAVAPVAVKQPTITAIEGAPKLDPEVEPVNKEAAFSFQFQENLDPFAGQLAFEMGKKILIANNNDDKLFAKNTCELIVDHNGDPKAAAAHWAEINNAIGLEQVAKEIVYQWQFDAARKTKVCKSGTP